MLPPSPLLAACLGVALAACGPDASADPDAPSSDPPTPTASAPPDGAAGPYRFDRPVVSFDLPDALVEISGLTDLGDGTLGAVQDEDGELYVLSQETGAVVRVVPFGPPGDYEGVELAGDRLFVLRADGALLELSGWQGSEARPQVTETGLGAKDCDAEGLGTDGARLLIACKKEGDDAYDNRNVVWAYDLGTGALGAEPAFVVDPDAVEGDRKLRPSALAVHPATGAVVLLSSRRESLVALDAGGRATDVWDLGPAAFEQPEGLAFLPNGDVWVSSEGGDGPAVLARFAYAPASP
ncbi:hypothetical protein [Rubrivirga marina]|uniref:Phytase-like domain-containing protein n=1 Tax=Rubrivirga marina TaxID=1196024 RepID=A0A271ITT2_9BACT|nr:hypothetical protein [Rubrivirga marina]PAP74204.1 hypothetical protein BSZ37_21320 [Rubrivirga marina]